MAALVQPGHPSTKPVIANLLAAARTLAVRLDVLEAGNDREIELAYLALKPGAPLLVGTDPFFFSRRAQLVALSARGAVPAIYDSREFAEAGGLMSYGPNHVGLWQEAGTYVGRILRGENRPSCRSRRRRNSRWFSTSRPRTHSASRCRRCCSPAPTR